MAPVRGAGGRGGVPGARGWYGPSLIEWMAMTQEELSARYKGSPIKRARRSGPCATSPLLGN